MGESLGWRRLVGESKRMVAPAQTLTVYNVPAKLLDQYRGCDVIVRSSSPRELVECLQNVDLTRVRFMQLSATAEDTSCLESFGTGIPIDVVLNDPSQYQQLYNYSNLLDTHPIRITIPVIHGFSKAVKLAISLQFAVKLDVQQPDEELLRELESVLEFYLHRGLVNQPIEFFHSLLLSFFRDEPASLWEIAEIDSAVIRYILEEGNEAFTDARERLDCHGCEFLNRCRSYFKYPDANYNCDGIKRVFQTLANAAAELKHDLESYTATEVVAQS